MEERQKLLRDSDEPSDTFPKTLSANSDPVRVQPTIDREDPTRPNVRHESMEPKCTKFSVETASDDLTEDRKLMVDPTRIKQIIVALVSSLDKFLTEIDDDNFI